MKKTVCYACGHESVVYTHHLNAQLVDALSQLVTFYSIQNRGANLQKDLRLTKNQYNNFQKLQYFDLVLRNNGWLPTSRGILFMRGITYDDYDKMIVDLKKKEQDLLSELAEHSKADEEFLITSSYLLELAKRAHELFMSSQPAQKNKLLRLVLANLQLKDGKLVPKLKNFFQGVLISNERQDWLPLLVSMRTEWYSEIMEG